MTPAITARKDQMEKRGKRPTSDQDNSETGQLLMALGHPLRRQILQLMASEELVSPRDLSRMLRRPLSNLSYHVRVLSECGAIELVDMRPVRGSAQHFYRVAIEAEWAWAVLGM
jgi:DNA-binding transcriptional ArsR family regulator